MPVAPCYLDDSNRHIGKTASFYWDDPWTLHHRACRCLKGAVLPQLICLSNRCLVEIMYNSQTKPWFFISELTWIISFILLTYGDLHDFRKKYNHKCPFPAEDRYRYGYLIMRQSLWYTVRCKWTFIFDFPIYVFHMTFRTSHPNEWLHLHIPKVFHHKPPSKNDYVTLMLFVGCVTCGIVV